MAVDLIIPEKNTPAAYFDFETSRLYLTGISLPENPRKTFQPLVEFVESIPTLRLAKMDFLIDLKYANSSTHKIIFQLLKNLQRIRQTVDIKIYWYVEDEDLREAVKDIKELLVDLNIHIIVAAKA